MKNWIKMLCYEGLVLAAALCFMMWATPAPAEDKVTVFAAASLKNALDAVNQAWKQKSGHKAVVSYAASSALAKQIENGAPADLFISADIDWMNHVAGKNLIRPETRVNLLGNHLVLVAQKNKAQPVIINDHFDLAALLGDHKLAMGEVKSVPAGKYGKAALEKLGVWASVENKIASTDNVRAALALVSRGEAPYGIVYRTDAADDPEVATVGTFPAASHPPIIYPVAVLASSANPLAADYLAFLKSPEAARLFEQQGFTLIK